MRAVLLAALLVATRVGASPQSLLTSAGACPVRAYSVLAAAIGVEAAESVTNGPTALSQMGGAIDSTMALLGPIFLDHAATLGAGHGNVNVLGQTELLDHQNGTSLDPEQTVVFAKPVVAARLEYAATIRQAAVGFAASYGVTDNLDVSLLMPLVFSSVAVTASRQVTHVLSPAGTFVPVPHQPVVRFSGQSSAFAQGDLTARAKYHLLDEPVALAAVLSMQFPTGVPILLTGTGHYWIDPKLVASYSLGERIALAAELGFLVDLTQPNFSKLSYGIGASAIVIPQRLAAVVEVFGQSDLVAHFNPNDAAVLTLQSHRTLETQPALNLFITRDDQVNLSAGLRAPVLQWGALTLLVFLTAVVPLNQQGLRPSGAFITMGIGGGL